MTSDANIYLHYSFCCQIHIKVFLVQRYQRFDMYRSILSLSKIAHQMWHDHSFNQRFMTTERTVEVMFEGDKEVGAGEGGGVNKI